MSLRPMDAGSSTDYAQKKFSGDKNDHIGLPYFMRSPSCTIQYFFLKFIYIKELLSLYLMVY
jgi:hypothetical protein